MYKYFYKYTKLTYVKWVTKLKTDSNSNFFLLEKNFNRKKIAKR